VIPRIVYVDGLYRPYGSASVHVEDRGLLFGDAVYEVCAIRNGRIFDLEPHFDRLERSLRELSIAPPMSRASLGLVIAETLRRNTVVDGLIYIQVSRGVAPRDHAFPDPPTKPSLVVLARAVDVAAMDKKAQAGVRVVTTQDIRWARRDIKTTGLLANVLGKQAAKEAGAGEVWFYDERGDITEGGSTNAWIVDEAGVLRTRDLSSQILAGVTRRAILGIAQSHGLSIHEAPFTVAEARRAREAFSTSAVALVMPVFQIDDAVIGHGTPGKVAIALRQSYLNDRNF
jgi:D-alanine transaminase